PHSATTDSAISACITCRPAPTATANSPSRADSTISDIATLTCSGTTSSLASVPRFWYCLLTAVPCLSGRLGGRPTPTARQRSGGGPPPQLPRGPGQPLTPLCQLF